jgi:hypothetical protein
MKIAARMRRRKAVPPIAPPIIVLVGVEVGDEDGLVMLLVWVSPELRSLSRWRFRLLEGWKR